MYISVLSSSKFFMNCLLPYEVQHHKKRRLYHFNKMFQIDFTGLARHDPIHVFYYYWITFLFKFWKSELKKYKNKETLIIMEEVNLNLYKYSFFLASLIPIAFLIKFLFSIFIIVNIVIIFYLQSIGARTFLNFSYFYFFSSNSSFILSY